VTATLIYYADIWLKGRCKAATNIRHVLAYIQF